MGRRAVWVEVGLSVECGLGSSPAIKPQRAEPTLRSLLCMIEKLVCGEPGLSRGRDVSRGDDGKLPPLEVSSCCSLIKVRHSTTGDGLGWAHQVAGQKASLDRWTVEPRLWGGVCVLVTGSGDRGGTPLKVKEWRMASAAGWLLSLGHCSRELQRQKLGWATSLPGAGEELGLETSPL